MKVGVHLLCGREWPYEEPEKPQHATKPRGAFGQYKKPKGHKHEKAKQQRCPPRFLVARVCCLLAEAESKAALSVVRQCQ